MSSTYFPHYSDTSVSEWLASRRYQAESFPDRLLQRHKPCSSVAVVIPAKECAATIAGILHHTIGPFVEQGLVDELVVVDANSQDGTAELAEAAGARVIQEDAVLASFGPARGKGDAMWRAVHATQAGIVCFLDADTLDPNPSHLRGLLGPLLTMPELQLVKGAFSRPMRVGEHSVADEGGRVTELMARPWLNLHEPRLAGFLQPLAGEFAVRRELLEAISFPVGYGIEIAVLMDALRLWGLDALAECDLGTRQNRHQPLRDLGGMAYAVLAAMEHRRRPATRILAGRMLRPWADATSISVQIDERPPLRSLASDSTGTVRSSG